MKQPPLRKPNAFPKRSGKRLSDLFVEILPISPFHDHTAAFPMVIPVNTSDVVRQANCLSVGNEDFQIDFLNMPLIGVRKTEHPADVERIVIEVVLVRDVPGVADRVAIGTTSGRLFHFEVVS